MNNKHEHVATIKGSHNLDSYKLYATWNGWEQLSLVACPNIIVSSRTHYQTVFGCPNQMYFLCFWSITCVAM